MNDCLKRLKITQLNDMQQATAEAIARGKGDVIVLSPTGSGKTLAYLLPLIQLTDAANNEVQALVITPGRELALQSDGVLKAATTALRSTCCYGGRPTMDEHRIIRRLQPQIIFGTPGRLNDHLDKDNFSRYGIRYVVIDEFDKCLEMGFQKEMAKLLGSLPGLRRRFLLSATEAEEIPDFVNMRGVTRVDFLDHEEETSSRIAIHEVKSPQKDKLATLDQLLRSFGQQSSIVFLNFRESVERTAEYLGQQGFTVSLFHGALQQKEREDALYRFTNGSANVLVATDLASRGLDIPDIENIVHYHLPLSQDAYIHRIGRTARWEAQGRAFFLIGPEEHIPEYIDNPIEPYGIPEQLPPPAQPRMSTLYIGKGKKDKISKGDIVGFLCKKGGLEPSEIGKIDVKEHYAYCAIRRERMQEVIQNVRGEKIKGVKTIIESVK
ncbi:MAG: DEAD/DEAH box helicase [Prevotella sp.]